MLQLPITPLGPEAIAELVEDWVGKDPTVAGLAELVGERCGGNPFFAEEILQSLIETGALEGHRGDYRMTTTPSSVLVPVTVQSLLASRIDRLAEREKQLLYTAAVIGKEFQRPLLEAAVELPASDLNAAISELLTAEMIFERALYPTAEYAFKHPLTHEVALHAQLRDARAQRHELVARAIEQADAGNLDEKAALLAHHWSEAGGQLSGRRLSFAGSTLGGCQRPLSRPRALGKGALAAASPRRRPGTDRDAHGNPRGAARDASARRRRARRMRRGLRRRKGSGGNAMEMPEQKPA